MDGATRNLPSESSREIQLVCMWISSIVSTTNRNPCRCTRAVEAGDQLLWNPLVFHGDFGRLVNGARANAETFCRTGRPLALCALQSCRDDRSAGGALTGV